MERKLRRWSSLTLKQRFQLEQDLLKYGKRWKHKGLRQINIPKPDGTQRTLKIPTIKDRAWQCLIKIVTEPAHEAHFHARSYGFRPGRSTHDCQKFIYQNLSRTTAKIRGLLNLISKNVLTG